MIILKEDFFNKARVEIRSKYFPTVIHGKTENPLYYKTIHLLECFHNGVIYYETLINKLSKNCKDTKENIHKIIKEFIKSFGSYKYSIK
jgi:hypothetical protein